RAELALGQGTKLHLEPSVGDMQGDELSLDRLRESPGGLLTREAEGQSARMTSLGRGRLGGPDLAQAGLGPFELLELGAHLRQPRGQLIRAAAMFSLEPIELVHALFDTVELPGLHLE